MAGFVSCSSCQRLIANDEPTCPFCAARSRSCSALAVVAFGAVLAVAGCGRETISGSEGATSQASGEAATGESSGSDTSSGGSTTSTDGSSSTESSTTDDSATTASFYAGGDISGGPNCGEECDIWAEADCPEGEKCTAVDCDSGGSAWDANVCRAIQGDALVGDDCTSTDGSSVSGNDTCQEGAMCWDIDSETNVGTCIAFCEGSPDAPECSAMHTCFIANAGVLAICLPNCNPLSQDCENPDDLCIPSLGGESSYVCVLNASGDMAPYGAECNYPNVCNHGLLCIDPDGVPDCDGSSSGCCSPMCSISAGEACPGVGQTCEPVFDPQPPGYEDVGVCMVVP